MNVLFVCEGFNRDSVVAQPWKHIYELSIRMKNLGHEVTVLTDLSDNLSENEFINGISICRIEKGLFFFKFDKLINTLNDNRWDIINWVGGPLSALYFSRLRQSVRKKFVWTMYKGKLTFDDFKNLGVFELISLLKDVQFIYSIVPDFFVRRGSNYSNVDSIVVWSKRLKKYLADIGVNQNKISIVSSGVDTESFRPISETDTVILKEKLGFRSEETLVLYFGSLSSFRGLDVLISAMNKVAKKNVKLKLLVLAREKDTSITNKLLELVNKQIYTRVVAGILSQSEVIQFLSIADIVALPFKSWPHQEVPLTVLEAMSMGKIVISTNIWPILDYIEDGKTGILVSPNNVDRLAEKIIEVLLNQKEYVEIGNSACSYVKECHDWNIILKRTLEIFQNSERIVDDSQH